MRAIGSFLGGLALLALATAAPAARAQEWPNRPVRLVVPYAAGGTTDILARLIAERFQPLFGQPLVVDIRPGAGGTIGSDHVAKSPPDGYTLLVGGPGTHATAQALYPNLTYDQQRDFAPISMIATLPNIVVVNPALPHLTPKASLRDAVHLFSSTKAEALPVFEAGKELVGLVSRDAILSAYRRTVPGKGEG